MEIIRFIGDRISEKTFISPAGARGLIKLAIQKEFDPFISLDQISYKDINKVIQNALKDRLNQLKIPEVEKIIDYVNPLLHKEMIKKYIEVEDEFIENENLSEEDLLHIINLQRSKKDLLKWLEKNPTSQLQALFIKIKDLFPVRELIKLKPTRLTLLSPKLIWVSFNTTIREERELIEILKKKTTQMYGKGVFETIQKEINKMF